MPQDVTAADADLRCPYCGEPVRFRGTLVVGRCEHLLMVQGHRDGPSTASFKASDEYFVFDTTRPPTVGVYVKRNDPRYARAFGSDHADPGWPPPIR